MDIGELLEILGEDTAILAIGLMTGLLFGVFAQRSKFCFRAAIAEIATGKIGSKLAIWLIAFSATIVGTQALILGGLLDVSEVRQLAARGSLSGAIIGGALFGVGMVLARGCASRILILSATGNLRMLVTGLVLTIIAQASYTGILSPLREYLSGLWTVSGGYDRDLTALLGLSQTTPFWFGVGLLAVALWIAVKNATSGWVVFGALGVGASITFGWAMTYGLSSYAFDPVAIRSINFIGPSADTLMGFITERSLPMTFNLALVPGVFVGSFIAAALAKDLKLVCFSIETRTMPPYMIGAVLMGFGGMLAGGCAVGAAVTGSSVFALTAWVALAAMGISSVITNIIVDKD